MKGRSVSIEQVHDEHNKKWYLMKILLKDKPEFKLGECEVKQT